MTNRKKEIAKFACGFEAAHAASHGGSCGGQGRLSPSLG